MWNVRDIKFVTTTLKGLNIVLKALFVHSYSTLSELLRHYPCSPYVSHTVIHIQAFQAYIASNYEIFHKNTSNISKFACISNL
jgi:hypothetical protein